MKVRRMSSWLPLAVAVMMLASGAQAWNWFGRDTTRPVRTEIVKRMEAIKQAAYAMSTNRTQVDIFEQLVRMKVEYVKYVRLHADDARKVYAQPDMRDYIRGTEDTIRRYLEFVDHGMMAYILEQQGYFNFDGFFVFGDGCFDDMHNRHRAKYENHPKWPRGYRPGQPGPKPGPAPIKPAPGPKPGPAPIKPAPGPKPGPAPAVKPGPAPAVKPGPQPGPKPGQPGPKPGQPGPGPKPMPGPQPGRR